MIGGQLRRPARRMGSVGSPLVTGGGGPCLLLVRRSGAFREVAGRLARLLGWLEGFSGERGESLGMGSDLGLMVTQVFVVLFLVCGGWLGLMVGVSGR